MPVGATSDYDEVPGAVGEVNNNKAFDLSGYEPLSGNGNVYNSLDEIPRLPSTGKRPKLASKPDLLPKPRTSLDENGYLKF